jgi:ribonuclease BN (tRNA processing enzyme)
MFAVEIYAVRSCAGRARCRGSIASACRRAAPDLLIAEAYCFERKVRFHLDYATLREKLPMIGAKRLILTHMSPDMLGRVSELQDCEAANDGLEIEIV